MLPISTRFNEPENGDSSIIVSVELAVAGPPGARSKVIPLIAFFCHRDRRITRRSIVGVE
jgi:hypothetical protein